jgi:hypothetical protein
MELLTNPAPFRKVNNMELHRRNAAFTSTEADWVQGLYMHKNLLIVRHRILIARRNHAALYVPAMNVARRSLLEAPGNVQAILDLDRERAALREVETTHGVAADGRERHIIAIDLYDPHRQLLLRAAELEQDAARESLADLDGVVVPENVHPFDPSSIADPEERQLQQLLQPGSEFSRAMEAGNRTDYLATIAVTAGIIFAIQGATGQ